jgi:hypothetical protein
MCLRVATRDDVGISGTTSVWLEPCILYDPQDATGRKPDTRPRGRSVCGPAEPDFSRNGPGHEGVVS